MHANPMPARMAFGSGEYDCFHRIQAPNPSRNTSRIPLPSIEGHFTSPLTILFAGSRFLARGLGACCLTMNADQPRNQGCSSRNDGDDRDYPAQRRPALIRGITQGFSLILDSARGRLALRFNSSGGGRHSFLIGCHRLCETSQIHPNTPKLSFYCAHFYNQVANRTVNFGEVIVMSLKTLILNAAIILLAHRLASSSLFVSRRRRGGRKELFPSSRHYSARTAQLSATVRLT
jgi:hypothetical protein